MGGTAFHPLSQVHALWNTNNHVLETPASGGTFVQRGAYYLARVPSGTYKLPDKGAPQYVYATSGPVTITSADGTTVDTLDEGDLVEFIPTSETTWKPNSGPASEGVADIATEAELQSKLDSALTNGYLLRMQTDATAVDTTIDIDPTYGGKLEGYGAALPANVAQQSQHSAIPWTGSKGGSTPLIRYKGAQWALRDLSLWGDTKANIIASTATKGDIGLLVERDTIGTGKVCAQNLLFDTWEVALQLGTLASAANCDESMWSYMQFYRSTTAVKTMHRNVMGHHFLAPQIHTCVNGFEILGGGNLTIDGGGFYSPSGAATSAALIRYRNDTTDEIGHNNGAIVVNNFKIDSQCRGIRLLDMESVTGSLYAATVRFNQLQTPFDSSWSESWSGPMFVISGSTDLIIDGAKFLYPNGVRWNVTAGVYAKLTVINCKFCRFDQYTDFLDTANSSGDLQVRFWNNSGYDGANSVEVTETLNGSSIPATVTVSA